MPRRLVRFWVIALLLLSPVPATAQLLSGAQDARVKAIIAQLAAEAERCSLAANAKDVAGPIKVQLDLDSTGKLRKLAVVDALRKADVGKCIGAFRPTEPIPTATFEGGKVIRLEVGFHPWAARPKRSWTDVRAVLRQSGAEAALAKCTQVAERPAEVELAAQIALDGRVELRTRKSPLAACFSEALHGVEFGPSQNLFRFEYTWAKSSKPTRAAGFVVAPDECVVEQYPCTWAETDPAQVHLGNDYVKQLSERIDCTNPAPAIAWLEQQPKVRWVRANGCHVSLLVEGSRPVSYLGP